MLTSNIIMGICQKGKGGRSPRDWLIKRFSRTDVRLGLEIKYIGVGAFASAHEDTLKG